MKYSIKKFVAFIMAVVLTTTVISTNAYANDDIVDTSTTQEQTTKNEDITIPTTESETIIPGGSEGAPQEEDSPENEPTEDEIVPEDTEDELNDKEEQIESELNETENQMSGLDKNDAEYVKLLDKKIGYINAQLMIYDNQVVASRGNIDALQLEIDPLVEEINMLESDYNEAQSEYDYLSAMFEDTYNRYCARLRAFYVTGDTSVVMLLLGSKDMSQFLTRLELISIMTKKDGEFLQEADRQMNILVDKKNGLADKKMILDIKKQELITKMDGLKSNQDNILKKQEQITTKKLELTQIRAQYPAGDDNGEALFYNSNDILNMTYPVPSQHGLSLGYGHYSDGRPHRALDFPLHIGSSVVAAQKGMVIKAVDLGNRSYGKYVMIYHGTDIMGRQIVTLYAHNSELLVTPGQNVEKGQQIAKGGSTGNSTGPHSHFELRVDNKQVNPLYFLS